MIDLRGHGQSGDARFTFGLMERRDVMGAADWLKTQGFKPGSIGALGVSLGAASTVGAAAEDTDIGAAVVDSGFAEWCPVMYANWNSATGLPDALIPPVRADDAIALRLRRLRRPAGHGDRPHRAAAGADHPHRPATHTIASQPRRCR